MKITLSRFTVAKRHALTISRGTSAGSENLLIALVDRMPYRAMSHSKENGLGRIAMTASGQSRPLVEALNFVNGTAGYVSHTVGTLREAVALLTSGYLDCDDPSHPRCDMYFPPTGGLDLISNRFKVFRFANPDYYKVNPEWAGIEITFRPPSESEAMEETG